RRLRRLVAGDSSDAVDGEPPARLARRAPRARGDVGGDATRGRGLTDAGVTRSANEPARARRYPGAAGVRARARADVARGIATAPPAMARRPLRPHDRLQSRASRP